MKIGIGVRRTEARQWLLSLRSELEADGHQVSFRLSDSPPRHAAGVLALLERLEARLYGAHAMLSASAQPLEHHACEDVDLFIALGEDTAVGQRNFRLFLNDKPGIEQAIPILLERQIPLVELRDANGRVVVSGLPAIETPDVITSAQDWFNARLITMIRLAVVRRDHDEPASTIAQARPTVASGPLSFGAGTFFKRMMRRINGRRWSDEHWSIGIRARQDQLPGGILDPRDYAWVKDDGNRYYADPILFDHEGRCFLFLEEFPYASAKGVIGFCELDGSGRPVSTPDVIIESKGHLSYPFLFRHEGEIYMMPENAAENRLPLYRAERFPDRWVFERNLLENVRIHDATPFESAGQFWILGNTEGTGGSSWDCLSLYSAPSPLGPFVETSDNPLLIDTRFSRSGGPVLTVEGQMIRPVQCCLGTYGRALRFMAVDRIEAGAIQQRQIGILEPGTGPSICGIHTYSQSQRFEAIDARGSFPRQVRFPIQAPSARPAASPQR